MARPEKLRCVAQLPNVGFFRPVGIPANALQSIRLSLEELESIRLRDLAGREQEECAQRMQVSRTTFARVLASARKKAADALLNGKAIRIEGGNFEAAVRRYRCANGHSWDAPVGERAGESIRTCPTCENPAIMPEAWQRGRGRGQRGRHHGGGGGRCRNI